MKRIFNNLLVGIFVCFTFVIARAAFAAEGDVDPVSFLTQVLDAVKALGGLSWMAKVSAIVLLLVGSMKVELIRTFVWDKIPAGIKPFIAPVFGLIGGLLSLPTITLPAVVAYVGAGAGAIILYELLDAIKVTYATNATVSGIIGFIQGILKTGK